MARTSTQSSPVHCTRYFRRVFGITPSPLHRSLPGCQHNFLLNSHCASLDLSVCSSHSIKHSEWLSSRRFYSKCCSSNRMTAIKPWARSSRTRIQDESTHTVIAQVHGIYSPTRPMFRMRGGASLKLSVPIRMVGKFNAQLSRTVAGNYSTNLFFIRSFTVASVLAHDRNRGMKMGSRSSNSGQGEHYPVIRLSNTEDKLCRLVDKVAKSYEDKHGRKPIRLRIAGGWVRDKVRLVLYRHLLKILLVWHE